jgi:microcystin degradation protein MlrC
MARIAIGGFEHETNTFAPSKATYEDFVRPGAWPGLTRGPALLEAVSGINLPIAGFIDQARQAHHALLPLSWAQATPAAAVTEEAFERIVGQIIEDLRDLRHLDAVYLDLHGAMVAEHLEDGEGEILARVRRVVGPDLPVVASLDLHANITPAMVELSDALVVFRTYPHVDMAETGARAALLLDRCLAGRERLHKAYRQLPFLIPTTAGCTLQEPARGLYAHLENLEREPLASLSFACGFGPADIYHCGPSAVAYGADAAAVEAAAQALSDHALAHEAEFALQVWTAEEAVAYAMRKARSADRPVILADTQDNPGGGANSDTVGLLAELVRQGADGATLALLYDPTAAAAAHAAGIGAELRLPLGAGSGLAGHRPLEETYRVDALGDGSFTASGPFYHGARMQLGPMALLALGGVRIVVGSRKIQAADQEIFRHIGIEPAAQKILALKSSVHFRADFEPIAEEVLVVLSPGPNPADFRDLPYRRLRPGVRLMPAGPAFQPV